MAQLERKPSPKKYTGFVGGAGSAARRAGDPEPRALRPGDVEPTAQSLAWEVEALKEHLQQTKRDSSTAGPLDTWAPRDKALFSNFPQNVAQRLKQQLPAAEQRAEKKSQEDLEQFDKRILKQRPRPKPQRGSSSSEPLRSTEQQSLVDRDLAMQAFQAMADRNAAVMQPTIGAPGSELELSNQFTEAGIRGKAIMDPKVGLGPEPQRRRRPQQAAPPPDPRDQIFANLMAKLQYGQDTGGGIAPVVSDISQLRGLSPAEIEAGQRTQITGMTQLPNTGIEAAAVGPQGIPFSQINPALIPQMQPYLQGRTPIGWGDAGQLSPQEMALLAELSRGQPAFQGPQVQAQLSPVDQAAMMSQLGGVRR